MKKRITIVAAACCVVLVLLARYTSIKAAPLSQDAPDNSLGAASSSHQIFLPFLSHTLQAALSLPACTLYVDSAASSNGSGTLSSPFNTLYGHTQLSAGATMCLRGT